MGQELTCQNVNTSAGRQFSAQQAQINQQIDNDPAAYEPGSMKLREAQARKAQLLGAEKQEVVTAMKGFGCSDKAIQDRTTGMDNIFKSSLIDDQLAYWNEVGSRIDKQTQNGPTFEPGSQQAREYEARKAQIGAIKDGLTAEKKRLGQ